jgi:hypothetical protein
VSLPAPRKGGHRYLVQTDSSVQQEDAMLWTIAIVLLLLWALGLVSSYTMGGFIHILLIAAVVMVLVSLITGRRATV